MRIYIYIHNKYTQYTHTSVIKNVFLICLIAINHLTALIYIYITSDRKCNNVVVNLLLYVADFFREVIKILNLIIFPQLAF